MEEVVDEEVSFRRQSPSVSFKAGSENDVFLTPMKSPVGKRCVKFADSTNVAHLNPKNVEKQSHGPFESESFKPADEIFGKDPESGALDVGFDFLDSIVTNRKGNKEGFVAKRKIRESVFQSFDPLATKPSAEGKKETPPGQLTPGVSTVLTPAKPVNSRVAKAAKCDDNLMGFTPEKAKPPTKQPQQSSSTEESLVPLTENNTKCTSKFTEALAEEEAQIGGQAVSKPSVLSTPPPSGPAVDIFDASPSDIFKFTERDVQERAHAAIQEARAEAEILQAENDDLSSRLTKESENSQQLLDVLSEFESTVKRLVAEAEQTKSQHNAALRKLTTERDGLVADLKGVESSFSDLHKRYEKLRGVVDNFRSNEEVLKQALEKAKASVVHHEQRYSTLHKHAEAKILQANETIEESKRTATAEVRQLESKVRQQEMKIQTLEQTVTSKDAENRELMKICDELIAKIN